MQKREGRAKHRSKRAWLPWGEDAPFETCGPQPKVGTLEPVAASETYSRDMQKEEGSSRRCSNLAWLPYVGDDDARPKAWIPQPKVGWLEPDKAFVAEADEVRESNFTRPKTQRVHWRLPHVDDDDSWPRAWIPQPKVEMSEPDRTSVAEIDEVRESRFTQSKTVEDWGSAATADPRKVKQDCDTDSSVSDIGEDVQVLIGGHDESTAWHYEEHTGWSRLAGGLECSVRLSDVRLCPMATQVSCCLLARWDTWCTVKGVKFASSTGERVAGTAGSVPFAMPIRPTCGHGRLRSAESIRVTLSWPSSLTHRM